MHRPDHANRFFAFATSNACRQSPIEEIIARGSVEFGEIRLGLGEGDRVHRSESGDQGVDAAREGSTIIEQMMDQTQPLRGRGVEEATSQHHFPGPAAFDRGHEGRHAHRGTLGSGRYTRYTHR